MYGVVITLIRSVLLRTTRYLCARLLPTQLDLRLALPNNLIAMSVKTVE